MEGMLEEFCYRASVCSAMDIAVLQGKYRTIKTLRSLNLYLVKSSILSHSNFMEI